MSDDAIISALVTVRDRCRQLTQWYQSVRAGGYSRPHADAMTKADQMLSQVLSELRVLPQKPSDGMSLSENRTYAESLLAEISGLLERALVADRELRLTGLPDGVAVPQAAMPAYTRMSAEGVM